MYKLSPANLAHTYTLCVQWEAKQCCAGKKRALGWLCAPGDINRELVSLRLQGTPAAGGDLSTSSPH